MKKLFLAIFRIFLVISLIFLMYKVYERERTTNIAIVGDVFPDVKVGIDYPYEKIKEILNSSDISFGNLAFSITKSEKFKNLSEKDILGLKNSGFNILNLANDHIIDTNGDSLISTINSLNNNKIITVGAGKNKEEIHSLKYIYYANTKIGFLSYSSVVPDGYISIDNKPDISYLNQQQMQDDVQMAKSKCDVLVVSFHWGKEFDFYAEKQQKDVAHIALDNGADIIVGHHPHVLQGFELYKGKIILYSLGNFIFPKQNPIGTDESIMLNLYIKNKNINKATLTPIKIIDGEPVKAVKESAQKILEKLGTLSGEYKDNISIKNGIGYVEF